MSRPNQPPRQTLRTGSKPKSTSTSNAAAVPPRRSAGTLPGIARTASTLRQTTTRQQAGPSGPGSLASIPAHLRNLSAPRIPSPLGMGTPGKGVKQNFPVRTSKTTEKHVLLPEDPQLAPMPRTPGGSDVPRPGRSRSGSMSSLQAATIARAGPAQEERSEAEKMTKREREENGLPRLTAYDTAESYRLKLLQAFLRREHGVGVVRVFDDCVYAVYNLPLLPGYGASTRVRSSPAVKSPGGVSMLERMTQAEEQGYEEEYFPVVAEEEVTAPHDPSEYILSHSPLEPGILESGMDPIMEQDESEASDGQNAVEVAEEWRLEREREHEREREREANGGEAEVETPLSTESAPVQGNHHEHIPGTHMSTSHPGELEHVPSTALSPEELSPPRPMTIMRKRYNTSPPRRRRRSNHNRVAEAVFFAYGVSVFFGFQEDEEHSIMEDIKAANVWQGGADEDDWENEEFHYVYDEDAEHPRIYNDMFTFKSRSHLFKLSLAHAIAQSTKLSVYETKLQNSLALTSSFPKELATTGHINLNRIEALKMTGKLFKLRMDVNLIGGILDTPELFWSDASLYPLYEAINQYLEIEPRVQVLNDRLAVVGDLLEIIHDYIDQRANHRITWVVIWLIFIAILVGVGEILARLVFHQIARDRPRELLLLQAQKLLTLD